MNQTFQKREICILDIHSRVEKRQIDQALKLKYHVTFSRLESHLNVEFKSVAIARDVCKFFSDKTLVRNGREFKIHLRGNRFLVEGMQEVAFEEVKSFFATYGAVNNVYFTKKYFATLASIGQAVDLVERVKEILIDGKRVEIKYAFDHNIGNKTSSNRNFQIKDKNQSKFEVRSREDSSAENCYKPIIQLGQSTTHPSKPIIELGTAYSGGDSLNPNKFNSNKTNANKFNNGQLNHGAAIKYGNITKTFNGRGAIGNSSVDQQFNRSMQNLTTGQTNLSVSQPCNQPMSRKQMKKALYLYKKNLNESNSDASSNASKSDQQMINQKANKPKPPNVAKTDKTENSKLNTLVTNANVPLFAKGPAENVASSHESGWAIGGFNSLQKLDYTSLNFKSTDYLENKNKQNQQVHTTTTYYNKTPQVQNNQTSLLVDSTAVPISTSNNCQNATKSILVNSNPFGNSSPTQATSARENKTKYLFFENNSTDKATFSAINNQNESTQPSTVPKIATHIIPPSQACSRQKTQHKKNEDNCNVC